MRRVKKRKFGIFLVILVLITVFIIKYGFLNKTNHDIPVNNKVIREALIHNGEDDASKGLLVRTQAILDKNITVVLDAGHGGSDSGTDVKGILEKDINLDITLRLGKLLSEAGVNIIYTRETDEYIGLKTRINKVNSLKADFLVSIHNNSFEDDTDINGTSTLYYTKNGEKEDSSLNSKKLAEIVQTELVDRLQTRDAGIIYRNNLGLLKQVEIPSVIAEIGYLTNPHDRESLMQDDFRQKTAEAVAIAVIKVIDQFEF